VVWTETPTSGDLYKASENEKGEVKEKTKDFSSAGVMDLILSPSKIHVLKSKGLWNGIQRVL
jgi:hypothetical protein